MNTVATRRWVFLVVLRSTLLGLLIWSPLAAAEPVSREEACHWRQAELRRCQQQLDRTDLAADQRDEWSSRLQWLQDWCPGHMPGNAASAAGERADDSAAAADALVQEPDLSQVDGAAQRLAPSAAKLLERATQLQTELWQLDTLDKRKRQLDQIVPLAGRLEQVLKSLIDAVETVQGRSTADQSPKGVAADSSDASADSLRWALAYTRYRRARAIAYRELPEVVQQTPIDDREAHHRRLQKAWKRLRSTLAEPRPEFVLLDVRMLRREGYYGQALELLERFRGTIAPKWYLKKRRDLLEEIGWQVPHHEAAAIYARSGLDDDP